MMRVVIKIASEVEQSISHVGWGNHHCENFGVGSVCSTLLNSSGLAGIYPRRCLGKSGLCRSQIRGLRMSHRLFLGCTRGPTPGTLIDQKGFYILCLLEPTFNKQQQLTKPREGCSWPGTWTFYGAVGSPIIPIMEDLRYFRSQMTVRFCAVPGLSPHPPLLLCYPDRHRSSSSSSSFQEPDRPHERDHAVTIVHRGLDWHIDVQIHVSF